MKNLRSAILIGVFGLAAAAFAEKNIPPAAPEGSCCRVGGVEGRSVYKESGACPNGGKCWVCQSEGSNVKANPQVGPSRSSGAVQNSMVKMQVAPVAPVKKK